jgi:predicted permease
MENKRVGITVVGAVLIAAAIIAAILLIRYLNKETKQTKESES